MDEQLMQIGQRLRGLRDIFEVDAKTMADLCGIAVSDYEAMERGEAELSVANLQTIARHYGISLDALLFGEEPKMNSYFLTRKGKGKLRIARELAQKGADASVSKAAVEALASDADQLSERERSVHK